MSNFTGRSVLLQRFTLRWRVEVVRLQFFMSEETSHIRSTSCNSHRNAADASTVVYYAKYQKQKMLRNLRLQGGSLENDGFAKKPVWAMIYMIFGIDEIALMAASNHVILKSQKSRSRQFLSI